MKKLIVFVTGYENAGGVSGWDWFYNKKEADVQFTEYEKMLDTTTLKPKPIIYRGDVEIEIPEDLILHTEEAQEEINNSVEFWLCENDFENAFK